MNKKAEIEQLLLGNGFADYNWIDPKEVIVAEWVRVKCTFGCSDYGRSTCPPNTPSVDACRNFFKEYNHGILIRLTHEADLDNYPSAWSKEMTNKLLDLERNVFLEGFQKAFLLNQTCCGKCTTCVDDRISCKDKKNARPSPEAFAVDVYQTVRNYGMEINVINKASSQMNRIAILLVE